MIAGPCDAARLRVAAVAFATAASVLWGGALEGQVTTEAIDGYVEQARLDWGIPGMAVAVVRGDSIVHLKGYGVRDLGTGEPVDAQTIFEITSATKTFTTAALGMLVAEGIVEWDDPVVEHLPDFRLGDPYVTERVTIRDLLAHRTGLAYGSSVRDGPYDRVELVRRMRFLPFRHGFREGFAYMHLPYLVAAQIVEKHSGRTWDQFVSERIFRPLGMTRTNTTIAGIEKDPNGGTPHELVDDVMTPVAWIDRDNVGPALSINSTAADLARWVALNLGGGEYSGVRLLPDDVVHEIHAPWNLIPLGTTWRDGRPFREFYPAANLMGASLGWFVSDYRGRTLVEHFGRFAEIALVPEADIGVVVLMNTPADLRYALTFWLIDRLVDGDGPDWSARMRAETVAAREERERAAAGRMARTPEGPPSLPLSAYAGTYEDTLYGTLLIEEHGSALGLAFSPIRRGPLDHVGGDVFRITWSEPRFGRGLVRFQVEGGRAVGVAVDGLTSFHRGPDADPAPRGAAVTDAPIERPRERGASVATVEREILTDPDGIARTLRGAVAGLRGAPGGGQVGTGVGLRVRGPTSVMGRQGPLVYLDGVRLATSPVPTPDGANQSIPILSTINPQDVDRIEILRGASARARYGMQASAGVILIYSKQGRRQGPG